jgi:hypothetical protein
MINPSYRPTDDEAHAAGAVARRRNAMNGGQSNIPGGETTTDADRLRQHYCACLSEIALSRIENRAWTGCGKGSLGVRDVGYWWEVRSITDPSRGLLIRPKDDPEAAYALVLVHPDRTCEVLGWAYGRDVIEQGRMIGKGTDKPCWILRGELNPLPMPMPPFGYLPVADR